MLNGLTFNNERRSYLTVLSRKRSYWAPIRREFIVVPGMVGAHLSNTETQVRVEEATIEIAAESAEELRVISEDMGAWLITDEPAPLVFPDEPDRTYYAVIEGSFDPDEIVRVGYGVIRFICPDPYKYGPEKTLTGTDTLTITNNGTAPTEPVIKVKLKEPTAYLAISNGEQMNLVGNPLSVDDTSAERLTRRFWSEADNLIGWTEPASVEGGAVSGTMATDGYKFYASDYGTGSGWHGPARKHSLPEVLENFQVDALVELHNDDGWGKIIISGLDQANNVVFSMSMGDAYAVPQALGQVRAGNQGAGHNIISHTGNPPAWNNFIGLLRIGRNKNTWYAFISRYDMKTGHYDSGMYREWVDSEKIYVRELAQIQVHIVSYGSRTPAVAKLEDIKVYRRNELTSQQIPLIGDFGDVIEFNHPNDAIYRNGELITKEKAFIGEYFNLEPGLTLLTAEPQEVIESVEISFREKHR